MRSPFAKFKILKRITALAGNFTDISGIMYTSWFVLIRIQRGSRDILLRDDSQDLQTYLADDANGKTPLHEGRLCVVERRCYLAHYWINVVVLRESRHITYG